jgi:predicted DNA-binding transcriptional regulator AlpA
MGGCPRRGIQPHPAQSDPRLPRSFCTAVLETEGTPQKSPKLISPRRNSLPLTALFSPRTCLATGWNRRRQTNGGLSMTNMNSGAVLRAAAAAEYLGLSISTLTKMRVRGDGPTFIRLGRRSVGYIRDDLHVWFNDRRRRSTSDNGPVPLRAGDDRGTPRSSIGSCSGCVTGP